MFKTIKNFNWIIVSSFFCILLGILTFLTFINQSFIELKDENLLILLIIDILLLAVFFSLIFRSAYRIYAAGKKNKAGSQTNLKYISLFSLFTFIPSLLVAVFSLFLFNYGVQNFFNDQIKKAVNNSYDVAKNYLEENKKTIKSDIFLMSVGINRASTLFYTNLRQFENVVMSEKILRRIDDVYLIDSFSNILFEDKKNSTDIFVSPREEDFDKALQGIPVTLSNDLENKSSVMIKINSLIDTYLYISRNVDPSILEYLSETENAVNYYYSIENSQTGIKITFAIIYIILVTLLLFLSTMIAISFASKLTKPIINLISASEDISKGYLNAKVPDIDTDDEFKKLNKNFNNMIKQLKKQQDKLLITERYSAWESVARKLAHEIKNPLTPIQLSIDRLKEKYGNKISGDTSDFKKYLETISRQVKDIENLANEFSKFARMPGPILKKIDINLTVKRSVDFMNMSTINTINFKPLPKASFINGDEGQLYRVFINLIKNSEESFLEISEKKPDFKGIIDIELALNNDYITINIIDNGTGIEDIDRVMTPYFTTKKNGTGLGLPIVNKIINEHSGEFFIFNKNNKGIEVVISIPIINEK